MDHPHLAARKHDDATIHPNRSSWAAPFAAAVGPTCTLRCGPSPIGTASIGATSRPASDAPPDRAPGAPPNRAPDAPPNFASDVPPDAPKPDAQFAAAFATDPICTAVDATPNSFGAAIDSTRNFAPNFAPNDAHANPHDDAHANSHANSHDDAHANPHVDAHANSIDDAQHAAPNVQPTNDA